MSDLSKFPGFWDSPISEKTLLQPTLKFSHLQTDDKHFCFIEMRPEERGRSVIIEGNTNKEFLPKEYNIKTRVNEYGGKCYTLKNNLLVFFDSNSQALFIKDLVKDEILPLYHKKECYFADLYLDPTSSYLYAVMEDKNIESNPAYLIRIHLGSKNLEIIHSTQDFYAQPRISPCGKKLAFLSWNHPCMPWDENILWLAQLDQYHITHLEIVCKKEGVTCDQITFSPDCHLYFTCDMHGYSQLYTFNDQLCPLTKEPINFGINHWIYGVTRLTFLDKDQLVMCGTCQAQDSLYLFNCKNQSLKKIPIPFTSITDISCQNDTILCIGASTESPYGIYRINLDNNKMNLIRSSERLNLDPNFISKPQELTLEIKNEKLYGFYYPPCNPFYASTTNPPLIFKIHSGPTAHVFPRYQPEIYFFTSRGFAYFELNYRGSSGYSKQFQNSLNGHWGEYDVDDVMIAAQYLVEKKLSNAELLFLKGSSAGGFTLLNLLCQSTMFKGAVSYYGVSDLTSLAHHTHKFEKHYLDTLIANFAKNPDVFFKRSPINHLDKISTPLLLLHGQKDPVVPIQQTISVYEKLKTKGNVIEFIAFSEEGHGFKLLETLKTCLEKELLFYQNLIKQHFT